MRVNFSATFPELAKLIGASAAKLPQREAGREFKVEEQKAALKLTQPIDFIDKSRFTEIPAHPYVSITSPDIQGKLNLPVTEPRLPALDSMVSNIEGPLVNEASNGVKTPSLGPRPFLVEEKGSTPVSIEERANRVLKLVGAAGAKHGIDPALGMAIVKAESSFNPKAVSSDGFHSKGLMQLLDSTGKTLLSKIGLDAKYDPFNPNQNVDLGVGYLRYLHDIFSEKTKLPNEAITTQAANSSSLEKFAVAAFNAGEGRVASAQERAAKEGKNPALYEDVAPYLPETTQQYVNRVGEFKDSFEGSVEREFSEQVAPSAKLASTLQ